MSLPLPLSLPLLITPAPITMPASAPVPAYHGCPYRRGCFCPFLNRYRIRVYRCACFLRLPLVLAFISVPASCGCPWR